MEKRKFYDTYIQGKSEKITRKLSENDEKMITLRSTDLFLHAK